MDPETFDKLEEALQQAGKDATYPPTPRLSARVRTQLGDGRARPGGRGFGLWTGLAAAACALILVFGALYLYNAVAQQAANSPAPGTAYTANLVAGTLSVVDLTTYQTRGSIPVGDNPWGMAVAPSGKRIFVSVAGGIAIVDTARAQRTDFIPLPSIYTRAKLAISADERILLVAAPAGQMTLLDMATRGVLNEFAIDSVPYDIKLSPDGRFAYVLGQADGSLAVVDVRKGERLQNLTFSGRYSGYFLGQSPDGRYLYVPRLARGEMWIVDTQTNAARGTLTEKKPYWQGEPASGPERGVAVSRDGARLYIATTDDKGGGVSVLDTQVFHEIARMDFAQGRFGAALNADGSRLLITVPAASRLLVLDSTSLNAIANVEVDTAPYRVVVGP